MILYSLLSSLSSVLIWNIVQFLIFALSVDSWDWENIDEISSIQSMWISALILKSGIMWIWLSKSGKKVDSSAKNQDIEIDWSRMRWKIERYWIENM